MSAWSRFVNLWRSKALDRELDDELRFHLDIQIARDLQRGADPRDAAAHARRRFGSVLRAREGMRDARVMVWLESLIADIQHGARILRKRGGLALLAIATLSLGIGANAAIFTLLNAILLRPLPYTDPDRLVAIVDRFTRLSAADAPPTIPEILDLRERSRSLANVAFFDTRDFRITGGDEPARVFTARVSASLFRTLGVQPALGRLFVDRDNEQGHWNVIVLSDALWRVNFGADPAVVGRSLNVNGSPHTVVGVLPRSFSVDYPGLSSNESIEMYVPFQMYEAYTSRQADFVNVRRVTTIARLRDEVTREQASGELQTIARAIAAEHPELYRRASEDIGFQMDAVALHDFVTRGARNPLTFLLGAVLLVLLIACVNTGQFMLAQSLDREDEVAVRASLGASRGRLFRQFLAESMLLAFAGGAVGLLQALWLVPTLVALIPGHRPELDTIGIDRTVLAFTLVISMASAIIVGVLPALYFSRVNLSGRLAGRSAAATGHRGRHLLVAVEVAVAVVLLAAAGLLVQGVRRLQNVDHGFSAENVTVMQVRGTGSQATRPIASLVYQHFVDHLAALPGVEAAATAFPLPFRNPPAVEFTVEGRPRDPSQSTRQLASYQIVSPDYFRVFRIPLRDGRVFSVDDMPDRPRAAIVSETLSQRHWPGGSAVGRQIKVGANPMTVVGVVGDVQATALDTARGLQIYVSNLQQFEPNMNIAVRIAPGSSVPDGAIKKAIWSVSPDQPVFNIQPMSVLVRGPLAEQRYVATLLAAFATLALFMSASGVYTVVAYLVARRTREIAVRLAIGAQTRDIVRLVAGQTFGWTIGGLVVGLGATISLRGLGRAALRSISDPNPGMLAALAAFYLLIAAVAVAVPVARALRFMDPGAVLRAE
jgi:putative ABC transport system permease protein